MVMGTVITALGKHKESVGVCECVGEVSGGTGGPNNPYFPPESVQQKQGHSCLHTQK